MRCSVVICAVLTLCSPALPQRSQSASAQADKFEIGRHTFFDFGPPFDFYEIFVVRATVNDTSIEKITLTPASDECIAPAKFETASASLNESTTELLVTNPCAIPEKDIRRELRRCKKCSVFSGANVTMQVQCGTEARLIRSDILNRDLFDPAPNTPEHTSWTMRLLERLDRAVGPSVMDKPVFPTSDKDEPSVNGLDSVTEQDLSAGKFDVLFQGAPHKPSELYRAARNPPPLPPVHLVSSVPFAPEILIMPEYPSIAKTAHVKGSVSFSIDIDEGGAATNLAFEGGPVLFHEAVKTAVSKWRFPRDASGQQIQATIEFGLNCSKLPK